MTTKEPVGHSRESPRASISTDPLSVAWAGNGLRTTQTVEKACNDAQTIITGRTLFSSRPLSPSLPALLRRSPYTGKMKLSASPPTPVDQLLSERQL